MPKNIKKGGSFSWGNAIFAPMKFGRSSYNGSLWFKRWSRRADASFLSIGKVVHIGRLKVDICRLAMLKSGVVGATPMSEVPLTATSDAEEEDKPQIPLLLEQLLLALLPVQVKASVAAACDIASGAAAYNTYPTSKGVKNLWMWDFSFCQQFKIEQI